MILVCRHKVLQALAGIAQWLVFQSSKKLEIPVRFWLSAPTGTELNGSVAKVVYAEDWKSLDTCSTQVWPTLLCDVIYLITLWCYSLLSDKSVCQKWLLFEKTIVILESNPWWWQGLPAKHCGQSKIWLRFDSVALLIEMLIESLFVHFWQWSGYSALLWNSAELFNGAFVYR